MAYCKQCGRKLGAIRYGKYCAKCSNIDSPSQARRIDTSQAIKPDLSPLGIMHTDTSIHGKPCDYMHGSTRHQSWIDSGIPAHAMPQAKPALKRTNIRDHARSCRNYRSAKALDFGAKNQPAKYFYAEVCEPTTKQIKAALRKLRG